MRKITFKLLKFQISTKFSLSSKFYKMSFKSVGEATPTQGAEQGLSQEQKDEVERKMNFFRRSELEKVLIRNDELDQISSFKPINIDPKLSKRMDTASRRVNANFEKRESLYVSKKKIVDEIEKTVLGKQFLLTKDNIEEFNEDLSLNYLLLGEKKDLKDYKSFSLIPLTNDEISLLKKIFDNATSEKIIAGGKEVLIAELKEKTGSSKEESNNIKLLFEKLKDYSRVTKDEIEYLKEYYPEILENKATYNLLYNIGSSFVNSLKKLEFFNKQKNSAIKNNLSLIENGNFNKIELAKGNKALFKPKINEKLTNDYTSPFILEAMNSLNYDQKKLFIDLINNKEFKNVVNVDEFNFRISNISMIKGLSADKLKNLTNIDYKISSLEESIKSYEMLENEYTKNNEYDYSEFRILFRVTLEFQRKQPNKENLYETHYALFNNEIEMPSNKVHLGLINYPELFKFYTLDNSKWQLVDIDNSKHEDQIRLTQSYISYLIQDVAKSHQFYFDENIAKMMNITINDHDYFSQYDKSNLLSMIKAKPESKKEEEDQSNKKDKKDNKNKPVEAKLKNKYKLRSIQDLSKFEQNVNSLFSNRNEIIKNYYRCLSNFNLMLFSIKLSVLFNKNEEEVYNKLLNFFENLKRYEESNDPAKFKSLLSEYESFDPCSIINYSQVSNFYQGKIN